MSFGSQRATLLLDPLVSKTVAFLLNDRRSNLSLAWAILPFLMVREGCRVLDLDALYSSNADTIAARVPPELMGRLELTVPEAGSNIERTVTELFLDTTGRPLIIDSANTLYQLLSSRSPKSSSRKFAFLIAALSSWARANARLVFSSTYARGTTARRKTARSLSEMFDVVISVSRKAGWLTLRCERGNAWREKTFFLPLEDG